MLFHLIKLTSPIKRMKLKTNLGNKKIIVKYETSSLHIWICNPVLSISLSDQNSGHLDRFATNFDWGTRQTHGILSFIKT